MVLIHGSGQSSDLVSLARELGDTVTGYVPKGADGRQRRLHQ